MQFVERVCRDSDSKENATSVPASRQSANRGASAAPMATYDKCHAVYGGCKSVTQSRDPPVPVDTA
jgi:hypothetical protein